jgi:hypothetical protein
MMEILAAAPDDHFILWHDLEAERHAIEAALPGVKAVYGSLDQDQAEARLVAFANGEEKYLPAKPEMSGSGGNYQRHCHKADLPRHHIQVQRLHSGDPPDPSLPAGARGRVHIIHTEAERQILATLQEKWSEDEQLRARMSDIIREHGLNSTGLHERLGRTIGVARRIVKGDRFELVNNDSVDEYARSRATVSSDGDIVPFGNHYEYSASYNDFGHNQDNEAFFRQMDYLTPQLLRTLRPGRVLAVHVKDRIRFGNVTGYGMPSVDPFHADCIAHYRKHGFIYFGMITIVTDVVRENNQTYRLGWTEQCKDGTKMGVGSPEYVLLFRKLPTDTSKGYADERVVKSKDVYTRGRWQLDAHAFWRSSGDRMLTRDELASFGPDAIGKYFERYTLQNIYNHEEAVGIAEALDARGALPSTFMAVAPASPHPDVWHDVTRMQTLNGAQIAARPDESHLPAAVRRRRPAHRALQQRRRGSLRSVRRPLHGPVPRGEVEAPRSRMRTQPGVLRRRRSLRAGRGGRGRDADALRYDRRCARGAGMTTKPTRKLDWFAWYPGDFRKDTQHLTRDERHAYRDLIDEIFNTNQDTCTLPNDDILLARITQRSVDEWKAMRHALIDGPRPLLQKRGKTIQSKRLTEEIRKAKVSP